MNLDQSGLVLKTKDKLRIKIFEERRRYEHYCEENSLNCGETIGITHMRYRPGNFLTNEIAFYWDKDWRKFWDTSRIKPAERRFYATLFHEATHQLLNAYTGKMYPKWLGEGLAVYFENTCFDGKEIYLPKAFVNPYGEEMKRFLSKSGDPKTIFSWNGHDPDNENAYYGLSASLIFLLMRQPLYRPYVFETITQLKEGLPPEDAGGFLLQRSSKEFWNEWINTLHEASR